MRKTPGSLHVSIPSIEEMGKWLAATASYRSSPERTGLERIRTVIMGGYTYLTDQFHRDSRLTNYIDAFKLSPLHTVLRVNLSFRGTHRSRLDCTLSLPTSYIECELR